MVDQVFTTIPKTRLDLAKLLKQHDFDVTLAVNEVQRILQLDNDKRKSIFSLYSEINDNLKKNKKSFDHLNDAWWNAEIPWVPTRMKENQPSIVSGTPLANPCTLNPDVERRKPLDEIQLRSKKFRLDQTGILGSIRQLAILENISVIRYVALLLYIVASEETGFKTIVNMAWKIYTG